MANKKTIRKSFNDLIHECINQTVATDRQNWDTKLNYLLKSILSELVL